MTQCCTVHDVCNSISYKSVINCKPHKTPTLWTTAIHPVKPELTDNYSHNTITFYLKPPSISVIGLGCNKTRTVTLLLYLHQHYMPLEDWIGLKHIRQMEIKYLETKVQTVVLCDSDTCTKFMTTFLHKSPPFKHKRKNVRIIKLGMYKPLTTVLS